MKCVYTSIYTDELLKELQKDKDFILSNFFALAVKDYYNSKIQKTSDIAESLAKARNEYEAAQIKFNEVNKLAIETASQNAQKELEKKKEQEEEFERWYSYGNKTLLRNNCDPKKIEAVLGTWVNDIIKYGSNNVDSVLAYYDKAYNQDKKEVKS